MNDPLSRPSMRETLVAVARTLAKRSTCTRTAVGCVIALDGRILATGYNGAPAGRPHCDHSCDCGIAVVYDVVDEGHLEECRIRQPCSTAIHAEANAVAFAARHGVALAGAELIVTLAPCLACAQLLLNTGVTAVYATTPYRDAAGENLLRECGIWRELT